MSEAGQAAKPATRRVLHVGCGSKSKPHLPGPCRGSLWEEVRYDIDPSVSPDIIGTITDLSGIGDGSFDALYSSHNVEHLFAHEVPVAFAEFCRVLKPESGIAIITCPDLQSIGTAIAEGKIDEPLYTSPAGPIAPLDVLFGHRKSVLNGNEFMAHRTGFTNRTLMNHLLGAGFRRATVMRQARSYALWAIGFRWSPSDEDMGRFRAAFFPGVPPVPAESLKAK